MIGDWAQSPNPNFYDQLKLKILIKQLIFILK